MKKRLSIFFLIVCLLLIGVSTGHSARCVGKTYCIWAFVDLTGGGTGALDKKVSQSGELISGDIAIVANASYYYTYVYSATNNNTTNPESSPDVIVPDDDSDSSGAWIRVDSIPANLGIGKITPAEALDIVGNISVSGVVDGTDISTHVSSATAHHTATVSGDIDHDSVTGVSSDDHHNETHAPESHSGTGITGAELEILSDTSDADSLHSHAHTNTSGQGTDDHHAQSHTVVSHSDTTATGLETETLTNGSNADLLHDHTNSSVTVTHASTTGQGTDDHHAQTHAPESHSATNVTGVELETLSDGSNADLLHDHTATSVSMAHGSTSGQTSDDHHAQSHTLASHSTTPHSALTGVGATDHHTAPTASTFAENGSDEMLGETTGTACTNGQILKSNGTGGFDCAADSTGGSPTFDTIATGANTTATMTVGTGGSLLTSGSGTIVATTASALVADGGDCTAGSYPLGVDASGGVENCTDASTEIDSIVATHTAISTAHHTATVSGDISHDSITGVSQDDHHVLSNVAYNATTWNANPDAATKDAIRDKIEALAGGHDAVTLAGVPDYLTLSTQEITLGTVDISDDTNLTAGDALTIILDEIDFDGGSAPAGELGGTWGTPTVDTTHSGSSHTHTVAGASHSDTTATGAELETLTNNSIADALHRHSELVAGDGTPDPAMSVDNDGKIGIVLSTIDTVPFKTESNITVTDPVNAVGNLDMTNRDITGLSVVGQRYLHWNSSNAERTMASIMMVPNNITAGSEEGELAFSTRTGTSAFTEKVRITNDGYMGVLTSNPATELDVNGTITATAFAGSGASVTGVDTGDTATAFFSTGTIEYERGGLEQDVNAYNGLIRITGGATSNVTNLSGLNTALGSNITDGAHTATAITDDLIVEADLNMDNAPVDADILSYDSTGANFAWVTCAELTGSADLCDGVDDGGAEVNALDSTAPSNILTTEVFIGTGSGTGDFYSLSGDATMTNAGVITVVDNLHGHTEANISDLAHTATDITAGIITEGDLDEDSGTPTDEDVLTYNSTGTNFNWIAQSSLSVGNATLATTATVGDSATAFFSTGTVESTYIEDAYLKNDANDTTTGTVTANGGFVAGSGTKSDGLVTTDSTEVQTTNATETDLITLALADENTYHVEAYVIGVESDGSNRASYHLACTVYRTAAGNATLQGMYTILHGQESDATWDVQFDVGDADSNLDLKVTGAALTTIEWVGHLTYTNMSN